jgi:hypothetical protein
MVRSATEQRIPELDTPEIRQSVFVLPETVTKNKEARVVLLNDIAQPIIESVRSEHSSYVFTWSIGRDAGSGWSGWRTRAGERHDGVRRLRRSVRRTPANLPQSPYFGDVRDDAMSSTLLIGLAKFGAG